MVVESSLKKEPSQQSVVLPLPSTVSSSCWRRDPLDAGALGLGVELRVASNVGHVHIMRTATSGLVNVGSSSGH